MAQIAIFQENFRGASNSLEQALADLQVKQKKAAEEQEEQWSENGATDNEEGAGEKRAAAKGGKRS